MTPPPDYGEEAYQGHDRLQGRVALITGGDSCISRAVARANAREGADVLISYLNEDSDAEETARVVREAGRKALIAPGDISEEAHCQSLIERTVSELGKLDILVNNAAFQMIRKGIEQIPDGGWEHTFKTNLFCPQWCSRRPPAVDRPGPRRASGWLNPESRSDNAGIRALSGTEYRRCQAEKWEEWFR